MIRIILSGCFGKMGHVIRDCVSSRNDCEIVAGVDIGDGKAEFPVFKSFDSISGVDADVIIDFSHPSVLSGLLEYASAKKCPAVVATTGLSEEQIADINECSKTVPMFFSANMSIGVNLISELAAKAARVLEGSFDIEIVEAHHNRKLDAPSGTALMLLDAVKSAYPDEREAVFGRHGRDCKRQHQEIGMHSLRGGTVTGEHEVCFFGTGERIRISHSAENRGVFAAGALRAAAFLMNQQPGMYSMDDVVGQL